MKEAAGKIRTIHPEVINQIGMEGATALLQVARNLRSGEIAEDQYNQETIGPDYGHGEHFIGKMLECKSACCILGWTRAFTTEETWDHITSIWDRSISCLPSYEFAITSRLSDLFNMYHPSDPQKAANAIEAFIYDYAERPWYA